MAAKTSRARTQRETTPLLEWILGGIGLVLFVAAIAFLVYEGSGSEDRPGDVEIRIEEIIATDDAYLVRYRARNLGTQTLVDLHISARVFDGSTELERVDAGIDYLPGRSWRRGGFYLREDPRKYRVDIRVGGYQEP